jgi:hypothetical protein
MKYTTIVFLILLSINISGQKLQSNVEFDGYKKEVLLARKEAMKAPGKLDSGEIMSVGCDQGTCYFQIVYKDRSVRQIIGEDITRLTIYEFDFGADGDLELVAVNDFKGTSYLYIFRYSRGIIQKMFEKEIKYDKVIIKKDYIEYYLPGGLDSVWHYYLGKFWAMTPYKDK